MKSLTYTENLKQSKQLFDQAQQATALLTEVLGRGANRASVEWDCGKDANGHDLLILRIADSSVSESAVFAPSELRDAGDLRWRLNRLWGDVLQKVSHKLLDKLLETAPPKKTEVLMTNTEKIDDLSRFVAILSEQLDSMRGEVARVRDIQTQVGILEHRINQLEKNADRWQSGRDKVLFLILGAVITLIVKHFWP